MTIAPTGEHGVTSTQPTRNPVGSKCPHSRNYPIERTEIIFRAFAFGFVAAAIAFYPALKLMGLAGAAISVLIANSVSTAVVMYFAWCGMDRERIGPSVRSASA